MLDAKNPEIKEDVKLQDMGTSLEFETKVEFLEAYGVRKRKTKKGWIQYDTSESRRAMRGLYGLTKHNLLYYERTYWEEKKMKTDVIAFMGSLVRMVIKGKGLSEEEIMKFRNETITPEEFERLFTYEIDIANILIDQWKNHFMLLPNTLFEDIRQITTGRQSKYPALFIEWLILQAEMRRRKMNVKKADLGLEIKIHYKNLARTLRMDARIKKRQWGKIRKELCQCFETACKMGYLSNTILDELDDDGMCELTFNPEKYPSFNKTRKHWQVIWHKRRNKKKASANSANIEPKQPEDIPYIPLGCK